MSGYREELPGRLSLSGGASADEEAAALAAVLMLLSAAPAQADHITPAAPTGWHASARVLTQGFPPTRLPAPPSWGRIERLRRAGRGGTGVVGQ